MTKKKRLGRGLEALLNAGAPVPKSEPEAAILEFPDQSPATHVGSTSDVVYLSVYEIDDNPFQPRRDFSEAEIASLSESLKEHDMLQPILVRQTEGRHQLISGERRLRAAIQAGWSKIPARVREADDRLVAELAIVENLQRKDLNAIEKALSFRRYLDEHRSTQEELANRLKIDRSTLTNLMRLLELPPLVQDALRNSLISAGHARALLPLGEESLQIEFCNRIQKEGMSVRQTEREVSEKIASLEGTSAASMSKKQSRPRSQQIESLERDLKMALGTKVDIRQTSRGKGKITIHFQNNNEFERLHEFMLGTNQSRRAAG